MHKLGLTFLCFVLCSSCQQAARTESDTEDKRQQTVAGQEPVHDVSRDSIYKIIDPQTLAKVPKPLDIQSCFLLFEADYDEAAATLVRSKEAATTSMPQWFVSVNNTNGGYLEIQKIGEGENSYKQYAYWNLSNGKKLLGVNEVIESQMVNAIDTRQFEFVIFDDDKWLNADVGILNSLKGKTGKARRESLLYKTIFGGDVEGLEQSGDYELTLPEKGKDIIMRIYRWDDESEGNAILKEVTLKWNDGKFDFQ